ncbi:MAG: hypothetical protein AAB336_09515 [Acidobacteriota bacterium]
MKLFLSVTLLIFFAVLSFAQDSTIEKNFERNKRNFSLVKFSIGEDASSGFDYLVYRQKTSTKKIRAIWSNYERVEIEDFYYENGKPLLLVKYSAKKSQYKSLAKGVNVALKAEEKFYFSNSKLLTWTEKGKKIQPTDSRWAEKEKEVLASFEEQLETFRSHLRGEL